MNSKEAKKHFKRMKRLEKKFCKEIKKEEELGGKNDKATG